MWRQLASSAAGVRDWDSAATPLPELLSHQDCGGVREASLKTMPLQLGPRRPGLRPLLAKARLLKAVLDKAFDAACAAMENWRTATPRPIAAVRRSMAEWLKPRGVGSCSKVDKSW